MCKQHGANIKFCVPTLPCFDAKVTHTLSTQHHQILDKHQLGRADNPPFHRQNQPTRCALCAQMKKNTPETARAVPEVFFSIINFQYQTMPDHYHFYQEVGEHVHQRFHH